MGYDTNIDNAWTVLPAQRSKQWRAIGPWRDTEAEAQVDAKQHELLDAADARIRELESERSAMALRIERLSAELAKPENVRLREVTEAMAGRSVMFDDIAERVRQELHELGRWIERAGKAERERNEALARATEAERHKGRRESQINELVARLNKFGAQCSALMATVRQYDAFCASSEQ